MRYSPPQQLDLFQTTQFTSRLHFKPTPRTSTLAEMDCGLEQRIAAALGEHYRVLVSVHDNRSTMISFRRNQQQVQLRIHHMFIDAPDDIIRAIANYITRRAREAGQLLDAYIADHQLRIRALPHRSAQLATRGRCFDLQILFDDLNRLHFQNGIQARIGWGRHTARRLQKCIRLGVYEHQTREIRVHPILDCSEVPRFFIEYIIFHEMLHQLFPYNAHVGRHVHHPHAFRRRERSFPRYIAALEWERAHLPRLLTRNMGALHMRLR